MSQEQEIEPLPNDEKATSSPAIPTAHSFRPWDCLFAAILVAAVFLVYQPAWKGGFVWNDDEVLPRAELRSWHGLYRIWFDVLATEQYYPMSFSAFWLEYKLWGNATLGYHLVNIFFHAASALLVAVILRRLEVPGACLAAAIFALHPVCVESVAWITELKNTLSGAFCLGALLIYLHFDRTRSTPWYLGAFGLFLLALLSKTATVMLPAVLPVIFWWQRGRLSWKRDLLPLVPFYLAGALAGTMTIWVERHEGAVDSEFNLGPIEHFLLAGRAICFYLGKLIWPFDLIFMYPRWEISRTVRWQYLFPAALLLLLAGAWLLRSRWRGPLAALLVFVVTLFPVLGFVNVYFFRYSLVADHFQYLASLAMIALFSAGVALLLKRAAGWGRTIGQSGCLLLLAVLAVLSWRQSRMYSDIETLFQTTFDRNPDCWMAYNNLGLALAGRGQVDEAIADYQKALEVNPNIAEVHSNLGIALVGRGRVDEAVTHYRKALEINPDYAANHVNLGVALAGRGELDEAIGHYRTALKIDPDFPAAHNNLGLALAGRGEGDEAIAHYRRALEINPDFVAAHNNLANALAARGEFDEAIAHFQEALEIKPDYAEAHYNLAGVLAYRGQTDEAVGHFRKALEIKPDYAEAHCNLGIALASLGQYEEALFHYEKALSLASARNDTGLAAVVRAQIQHLPPLARNRSAQ